MWKLKINKDEVPRLSDTRYSAKWRYASLYHIAAIGTVVKLVEK